MKTRAYAGPLAVLTTGVVGFSLFCIVSAAALTDSRKIGSEIIRPQNIVDSAISNMNTMAALTVEVMVQYVPTATVSPFIITATLPTEDEILDTAPVLSSQTPFVFVPTVTRTFSNPPIPTRTFTSTPTSTRTPTHVPTRTNTVTSTPIPTNTPIPTATFTPIPTDTPIPTHTPVSTDTPQPPTDTPAPPDTEIPTDTDVPTLEIVP